MVKKENNKTTEEKNLFKIGLKDIPPKAKKIIFISFLALFLIATVYISYEAINKNKNPIIIDNSSLDLNETTQIIVGEIDITGITEEEFNLIQKELSLTVPPETAYCIGNKTETTCEGTQIDSGKYPVTCDKENETLAYCYAHIPNERIHIKEDNTEQTCGVEEKC